MSLFTGNAAVVHDMIHIVVFLSNTCQGADPTLAREVRRRLKLVPHAVHNIMASTLMLQAFLFDALWSTCNQARRCVFSSRRGEQTIFYNRRSCVLCLCSSHIVGLSEFNRSSGITKPQFNRQPQIINIQKNVLVCYVTFPPVMGGAYEKQNTTMTILHATGVCLL